MDTVRNRPVATVLGMYGATALGVVRALGHEGIPVAGFHIKGKYPHAMDSKFTTYFFEVADEDELLYKLTEFGKKHVRSAGRKSIIFTTGDNYIFFCGDNANELDDYYYIPIPLGYSLKTLLHKYNVLSIASMYGFNVPESMLLSETNRDNIETLSDGRVICKPVYSFEFGKNDFQLFENAEEMLSHKTELLEKYSEMCVSHFVEGGTTCQTEVHTFLADEPMISMMLRKLKHYKNPNFSIGSLAESIWVDELIEPSISFTRAVNFLGPIDINLKKSENDGKYYFLEANLRASANIALDIKAGLNAPAILYNTLYNFPTSHLTSKKIKTGVRWMAEDKFSKMKWNLNCDEIKNLEAFVFKDNEDPEPLYHALRSGEIASRNLCL